MRLDVVRERVVLHPELLDEVKLLELWEDDDRASSHRSGVGDRFPFRLSVPIGSTASLLDIASQLLESRPRARFIVLGSNARRNVLE